MDFKALDHYKGISLIGVFICFVFVIFLILSLVLDRMFFLRIISGVVSIVGILIFGYMFTQPGYWTRDSW